MSFKQIDLIREGPSSESFEGIKMGGGSDDELIIRILAQLKEAEDHRKKNTDAIKKAEPIASATISTEKLEGKLPVVPPKPTGKFTPVTKEGDQANADTIRSNKEGPN